MRAVPAPARQPQLAGRAAGRQRPASRAQAEKLLTENHGNCQEQLETVKGELATVRDSVTILEVSMARVYNWDIRRARNLRTARDRASARASV